MDLLENIFLVAMKTCPIVSPTYLDYIREYFIYFWDKTQQKNAIISDFDWRELNMQLDGCILEAVDDQVA